MSSLIMSKNSEKKEKIKEKNRRDKTVSPLHNITIERKK